MSKPRPIVHKDGLKDGLMVRIPRDIRFLAEEAAKARNITLSEYIRSILYDALEDEHDLESFRNAYVKYQKDPAVYTFEEAERILESGEEI